MIKYILLTHRQIYIQQIEVHIVFENRAPIVTQIYILTKLQRRPHVQIVFLPEMEKSTSNSRMKTKQFASNICVDETLENNRILFTQW